MMANIQNFLSRLGIGNRNSKNNRCCVCEICPNGLRCVLLDRIRGIIAACQAYDVVAKTGRYELEGLRAALGKMVQAYDLTAADCGLVLHPSFYRLHVVDTPDVPRDEYRKAIRWQLRDVVDLPLEEICLDIFQGEAGRDNKKIYAIVAQKPQLQAIVSCFIDVGLQLRFIDIREFAVRNLLVQLYGVQGVWSSACLDADYCSILAISNGYVQFVRQVALDANALVQGETERFVTEMKRSWDYIDNEYALPRPGHLLIMPTVHLTPSVLRALNQQLFSSVTLLQFEERYYRRLLFDGDTSEETLEKCWAALGGSYRMLSLDNNGN